MHDIDRTQPEAEFESFEVEEFEYPEEVEEFEYPDTDRPLTEAEIMEAAADLLEVRDDAELEQFLSGLAGKVLKGAAGKFVRSRLGRQLIGKAKNLVKRLVPMGASALGGAFGGPLGAAVAGKAAQAAGRALGLELEGLGPEDQEFEVAQRVVELLGEATKQAAMTPPGVDPQAAADAALVAAAQQHAPALLRRKAPMRPPARRGPRREGRWYYKDGTIVLVL